MTIFEIDGDFVNLNNFFQTLLISFCLSIVSQWNLVILSGIFSNQILSGMKYLNNSELALYDVNVCHCATWTSSTIQKSKLDLHNK